MTEEAAAAPVTTTVGPRMHFDIDIAKASTKQLKFLSKQRDRDRLIDALLKISGQGIELFKVMAQDELLRTIAAAAIVHTLWRLKIIDEVMAVTLFGMVLGKGVVDYLNPFN